VPFREAHGKVGRLVRRALELRVPLRKLPLGEYQAVQPELDETVYAIFDFARSAARKDSLGGTAPQRVLEQCVRWRDLLD
jgi:argininosuccinate lyase